MQNEVQLIVRSGVISPTMTFTDIYTQAGSPSDYFESGATPPLAVNYPNGSKVEFYNNKNASVEFTTYVVGTDDTNGRVYINPPFVLAPDQNDGIDIYVYAFIGTNTFLDLYPNESISLSYQFTDLNNFTQIGTFSRDFRIPATKRNVEALGPLYDYNFVDDVLSFSRKYEAELRVDTIPISRGYLRIMAAYKQQDYLSDFQVAFYSQAPNFVKEIGEKKLADITDLTTKNENVVLPNVTVQNSFRIWGLIDRATGGLAFSEQGEINTRRVFDVGGSPLYAGDLTPCVRADYLLTEIFKDAGYELDASNLLTIIQDYYVPWCNTEKLIYAQAVSDFDFRVKNSTAITSTQTIANTVFPFDTVVFDSGLTYDPITYTYTPNAIGYYKFRLTTTLSNVNKMQAIAFKLRVTDPSSFTTDYYIQLLGQGSDGVYTGVTPSIFLGTGYTCQVIYRHQIVISTAPGTPTITYDANGTFFELEDLQILSNADIVYQFNAPDVKQIDFVSDIIKMHNLAVVPDLNIENKLKLEPMQTFIGSGATLDWTKKLDVSKDIVIKGTDDLRKTKLTFTYSAGQDTYSKLFVDQGRIYGDYKPEPYTTTVTQIPSSFATGETSVKLVAQSTPATQVNGSNIICPRFWTQSGSEPPKFAAPGLRFLYYSENADIYIYDEVSGFGVTQSVPTLTHYSNTSGFNPDYNHEDLNWAPETPLHDYTANPFDNLFTLYWRDYLDTVYSDDARILEANFALDNTDILSLNFADFVFVKDAYWRVLELSDYKMGQFESTRVKLLKMNPGQAAPPRCDLKPDSVNPDGSVNFLNLSGNPVSASETCCRAFNYTWSQDTNLCFARPSDRPSVGKPNNDTTGRGEIAGINTISSGINNINTTSNLDAGSSSFSMFAGNDIRIEGTNDNLIAVGDTIRLKGDQRGAALFGKSVEKYVPGFAVGGGYPLDDSTYKNGAQQAGLTILSGQANLVASPAAIPLTLEGIAAKYIELENDTLWFCEISVILTNAAYANHYAKATCNIWKNALGVANVGGMATQFEAGNLGVGGALTVTCDVATNPAQHRFGLQFAWVGAPIPGVRAAVQIKYTQLR